MYPVPRITGEGRAEFFRAWGHGFEQEGPGGGGTVGATPSVRGNYKSFRGINLTVSEGMLQFIMYILEVLQPVRRGRRVFEGVGSGGRGRGKKTVLKL